VIHASVSRNGVVGALPSIWRSKRKLQNRTLAKLVLERPAIESDSLVRENVPIFWSVS